MMMMMMKIKKKEEQKSVIKRNVNFKDYKNCLEEKLLKNETSHLKNDIEIDRLRENHKDFLKNNGLMLKSQQRFRSVKHNIFSKDINKIVLSTNDNKTIQLTDSIEIYAYGTNKKIIHENEDVNCSNIIKKFKNKQF